MGYVFYVLLVCVLVAVVMGRPELSPEYWYLAFFSDGFRIWCHPGREGGREGERGKEGGREGEGEEGRERERVNNTITALATTCTCTMYMYTPKLKTYTSMQVD